MANHLVILLVGLLHIVLTDGLSQQGCGMGGSSLRARSFGGKQSSPGMWPWQVGIHKQSPSDDSRYDILCGGALIDPQWVVTAAHCFYVKRTSSSRIWFEADITSLKKYKFIAGDINTQIMEPSQQERYATEVYIHPEYRHSPYYENDIALVKLNQTVTTSHLVGTVCLPGANVDLAKPGTVGTVAGWGRSAKSLRSTLLLHTSILIKTNAVCKQATRYYVNETVTFCAGDDNGRNDTCKGDSGGSLVRRVMVKGQERWVTVGLVSWGEGCGLSGKYGYYTRMLPFVTWIKDTVNSTRFSCSHPGDIPFGKLINDNRMTRFLRVKYRCVDGYILKGKSERKCKGGGKWTKPPVCVKERHCPYVRAPRNGVARPSKRRYSYKEKIRFYCVRNGVMIGRSSLTCKIDGRWDGYPPFCLASCPDPGIPKDSVRFGDNFKHGQTVIFLCKKRPMTGTPSIICHNGKWNSDPPTCGKAPCKDPEIPKGGRRLQHSFPHGDKVSFSCNKGWKMDGVANITCNDGKWDHKAPKCLEGCLKPRHSSNGFVSPNKHFYNDGEEVKMHCNWDYVLVGDSSARCSNGKWTKDPPSCNSKCRNPGSPHDGWADGTEYFEGKQVRFRCKNGYNVIGPLVIQCLDTGRWSGPVPQCKKRCSYRSPANSRPYSNTPLGASLKHGTTINHNCIKDYTLVGQKSITCNDSSWQPSIPSCKANCRDPGILSNGQRNGSSFNHLDVVKFSCDKEFVMLGASTIQCHDGRWTDNTPKCTECGSPLGMENGRISDRNIRASSRWDWRYDADNGRLNHRSSWCSHTGDKRPYLEIDLGKPYKITYVATQGYNGYYFPYRKSWVSKYIVSHNLARSSFMEYRETTREKLFAGNKDGTSIVKYKLKKPFIARKIRFQPVVYAGFKTACMRVEVYGCGLPIDCVMVGSRLLGRWRANYYGGYVYYSSYVKTISRYTVQLELENEKHSDNFLRTVSKTDLVLDVPNKQFNLPRGTRILMPYNARYYTATIVQNSQYYYRVDPDNSGLKTKWIKKEDIRVLKPEQFCASN